MSPADDEEYGRFEDAAKMLLSICEYHEAMKHHPDRPEEEEQHDTKQSSTSGFGLSDSLLRNTVSCDAKQQTRRKSDHGFLALKVVF